MTDEDLGLSGATTQEPGGFVRMTALVALRRVGILLGLEVSRLARNNADCYRLLDLWGMTDTLIGGADGVYPRAKAVLMAGNGASNSRAHLGEDDVLAEVQKVG